MQTVHIYDTARYFQDYYPDCNVAKKIMDRERLYWAVQQRYWTQDCQSSWYQGSDGAYIIQYALQALDFDWFRSGRFRKWLEWYWAACDNMGFMTGYGDCSWGGVHPYALWALQVGAWYYRDGWMQWMPDRNHLPRRGGFNLGHAFYTGEIKPAPPLHLGGLYRIGVDDWMVEYRQPGFPNERAYNKVSFQDGYTPGAPYLLLDGTGSFPHGHPAASQIVCFTKNGYYWLYGGGYMVFQTTEHNVMGIFRDGTGETPPPLAELRHCVALPGVLFSQSLLHGYNGIDWFRSILWRQGGTVLVIDRAQAKRDGQYGLQVVWRCAPREIDVANRSVHVLPNRAQLELMRSSSGLPQTAEEMNRPRGTFHLYNADSSTLGIKETAHDGLTALFESTALSLKEGESYSFRNLFFATNPDEVRLCRLKPFGEASVLIQEANGISLAGAAPLSPLPGIDTDAEIFWISSERIGLAGVCRLSAFGLRFSATIPVALLLDCRTGTVTISPPTHGSSEFTIEENTLKRAGTVSSGSASWVGTIAPAAFPEAIEKTLGSAWDSIVNKKIEAAAAKLKPLKRENSGICWRVSNEQYARWAGLTEAASPPGTLQVRITDLNRDQKPEILAARSDGRLFCLDDRGQLKWRYEAPTSVWDACAGDVDHDGKMEVALVCAASASSGENSFVILLDSGGRERWRVPCPPGLWTWRMQGLPSPRGEPSGPRRGIPGPLLLCWVADLNGDGEMEIGAAARNFFVYNFDAAGRERWEVMCPYHRPLSWRIQDLNRDGTPELLIANDFSTLVYRGDGSNIPDAFLPATSNVITAGKGAFKIEQPGPAIEVADLYGDGRVWIVNGTRTGAVTATLYDPGSDSAKPTWTFNTGATVDAVAIMETGGQKRIIAGSRNMSIYCLDREGRLIWSRCLGEMVCALVTGDIDNDGQAEILAGCDDGNVYQLNGKGEITGRRIVGSPVRHLLILPSQYRLDWNLLVGTRNGDMRALFWKGKR
jgi:outer membrane protein assembly factor BamB